MIGYFDKAKRCTLVINHTLIERSKHSQKARPFGVVAMLYYRVVHFYFHLAILNVITNAL